MAVSVSKIKIDLLFVLAAFGFVYLPPELQQNVQPIEYSTANAPLIIEAFSLLNGIDSEPLKETLLCESGFKASIKGDGNQSVGVAQINLPSHPTISEQQALDPIFSINWAAKRFKEGKMAMWTCWRDLYGSSG